MAVIRDSVGKRKSRQHAIAGSPEQKHVRSLDKRSRIRRESEIKANEGRARSKLPRLPSVAADMLLPDDEGQSAEKPPDPVDAPADNPAEAKFTTADQTMSTTDVPTSLADESIASAFNISEDTGGEKVAPSDAQKEAGKAETAAACVPQVKDATPEEFEVNEDSTTVEEMRNVAVLLRKQLRMVENRISSIEATYLTLNSNCNILTGYNPVASFPRRGSVAHPVGPMEAETEGVNRVDLSTSFLRGLISSEPNQRPEHMWAVSELYPQACRLFIPNGAELDSLLNDPVPIAGIGRKTPSGEQAPSIRDCFFSLSSCTSKPLLHLLKVAPTHKPADPTRLGMGNPIATPSSLAPPKHS